jgi:hypothetical protein
MAGTKRKTRTKKSGPSFFPWTHDASSALPGGLAIFASLPQSYSGKQATLSSAGNYEWSRSNARTRITHHITTARSFSLINHALIHAVNSISMQVQTTNEVQWM